MAEETQFRSQSHPGWNHGDVRVESPLRIASASEEISAIDKVRVNSRGCSYRVIN